MKRFLVILLVALIGSFAFACDYNSNTHTITNCKAYEEGRASEDCKAVHRLYEKWVMETTAKAAGEQATKVKEAAVDSYNNFMDSDAGKKAAKKARDIKDGLFKAAGDALSKK